MLARARLLRLQSHITLASFAVQANFRQRQVRVRAPTVLLAPTPSPKAMSSTQTAWLAVQALILPTPLVPRLVTCVLQALHRRKWEPRLLLCAPLAVREHTRKLDQTHA